MTNAIEVTKRAMQSAQKEMLNDKYHDPFEDLHYRLNDKKFGVFEQAYEAHLECLRQEIEGLRGDVRTAESAWEEMNRMHEALGQTADQRFRDLQLAEEASAKLQEIIRISGEELRHAQMLNRSYARQLAGTEESPALMTILGALIDAQRIMADWIHPDGIRARRAMEKMTGALDNEALVLAMREFEKPNAVKLVCTRCFFDENKACGCQLAAK